MSTLLLLPGDGIGPEVCAEVRKVAAALTPNLTIQEAIYGGAAYDALGTPLPDDTRDAALAADAVLMGAVGGPKWAGVARDKRPEAGLLNLRKIMDVFANLRPAYCFDALASASSLKPELVAGLDIMIVRELTSGVYFGEPRGIETLPSGERRGFDTQTYTTSEIERVGQSCACTDWAALNMPMKKSEAAIRLLSGRVWRAVGVVIGAVSRVGECRRASSRRRASKSRTI